MSVLHAPGQMIKGIQSILIEALMAQPSRPLLENAASFVPSISDSEDYTWLGEVPAMTEFIDEVRFDAILDAARDGSTRSYLRLTNKKYTIGLEIRRDDLADEKTGGLRQRINDMVSRGLDHVEKQLVDALTQGDVAGDPDAAGGYGYDGVVFFSASHTARGAQTASQTNLITYSGSSTANAQANIASSVAAILNFVDEANEPLNRGLKDFYIAYPPALHQPISEAITSQIISNTSNVQFKGLNWTLINEPRLTAHSAAEYYVGVKAPGGTQALVYQEREGVTAESLETGDTAFRREVYSYKARKRSMAGYGRWQRMVRVA